MYSVATMVFVLFPSYEGLETILMTQAMLKGELLLLENGH